MTVFDLQRTLSVRIVRRFFRGERSLAIEVLDVEGLSLRFQHPHRDRRIGQVCFIKMKNYGCIVESLHTFSLHVGFVFDVLKDFSEELSF